MMIRVRSKNVLLVAPNSVSVELLPNNKVFRHISAGAGIFPAIHELKPNLVILDYDFLVKDIEKILRRLNTNDFYNKIKICCYKTKAHTKVDSLLKTLGVDVILYAEDLKAAPAGKNIFEAFGGLFDVPVINWVAKPAH